MYRRALIQLDVAVERWAVGRREEEEERRKGGLKQVGRIVVRLGG
jgi:hypothetical protein